MARSQRPPTRTQQAQARIDAIRGEQPVRRDTQAPIEVRDRATAPIEGRAPPSLTAPEVHRTRIGPMVWDRAIELGITAEQMRNMSRDEVLIAIDAATPPVRNEIDDQTDAIIKRNNFKRIGEPRVAAAIRAIELLQPLADRNRYGYLDRDVAKLEDTLMTVIAETIELFRRGRGRIAAFHFDNGNGTYSFEEPPEEEEPEDEEE